MGMIYVHYPFYNYTYNPWHSSVCIYGDKYDAEIKVKFVWDLLII